MISYFPKWIILIKRGGRLSWISIPQMPQTASEAAAMTMNSHVTRRRRWREQCREQGHCITVGIYVCYPHPRSGRQPLLEKPTSAGESQQSMTVFAGSPHTACQSHASRKKHSVSHLLGGEHTCNCVKKKLIQLISPLENYEIIGLHLYCQHFTNPIMQAYFKRPSKSAPEKYHGQSLTTANMIFFEIT